MPQKPVPEDELERTVKAVERHGSNTAAAEALGVDRATVRRRLKKAEEANKAKSDAPLFETETLPDDELSEEELIAIKARVYEKKKRRKTARSLIHIKVNIPGPLGILVFGDPHLDDDGCNFPLLQQHIDLVRNTEGLFAACVGDFTNNWIGRLAHLYGNQIATKRQAARLFEWFLKQLDGKLLLVQPGNHDLWHIKDSGHKSVIEWCREHQGYVAEPYQNRVSLDLPCGSSYVLNFRHNWKGSSIYNKPLAGPARATKSGWWDDALICGDMHISQAAPTVNPATGKITWLVRVGSYKEIDSYPDEQQLDEHNVYEAVVLLMNPAEERHTLRVLDPELGAKVLGEMRKEWREG